MFAIMEEARKRYMAKYGVNPANPKVDVVDGVPLPVEYVEELVRSGKLKPESEPKTASYTCYADPSKGPKAIHGSLDVWVVEASDPDHIPTEAYVIDTLDGVNSFEGTFGVDMRVAFLGGLWDASDVGYDTDDLKKDLAEDMSWLVDSRKDIVLGWVDFANHNGEALDYNTHFAVCAVKASGADWPHDSIAQHETSHLFGAVDHTSITPCIMDYWDAFWGVDVWCGDCYSCINSDIK